MKYIPVIGAFLTGVFLTFCLVFEEPTIWLWTPYENPPWWQSDLLGWIGYGMKVPTLWLIQSVAYLAHLPSNYEPSKSVWTLVLCVPFLTIVAIALVVFCLAHLLLSTDRPDRPLRQTAGSRPSFWARLPFQRR